MVDWKNGSAFGMNRRLPDGMSARLSLPATPDSIGVVINGRPVPAKRAGTRWIVDEEVSGIVSIEVNHLGITANEP
jgi:hypothetical protein